METYISPAKSRWQELCVRPSSDNPIVAQRVSAIIERVRKNSDDALKQLSLEIDGLQMDSLEVTEEEFKAAESRVSDKVKKAIEAAYANIEKFHRAQMPPVVDVKTAPGVRCIQKPVPISTVGLYIPGGTAPLFSTVLMLAIPAKVAGCPQLVLCTPANRQTGVPADEVLYAARRCGIDRVFKVGGAQAIAAMAFGTESIPAVDKIFGPGNQYVTTAKQMLGGKYVAIDMPAGPSEVMVMADSSSVPSFVAADLLSQAEHGPDSQVMLVASSSDIVESVCAEVQKQTLALGRQDFAVQALSKSRALVFQSRSEMIAFANAYGSEHLIISMENPWEIADAITSAGSVFIGNYTPESAGDYASGTNHTLPTCGWSRAFSGVNIDSFLRKITFQEITRPGLMKLSRTIVSMADAEGLDAHANAVKIRLKK